MKIEMRFKLAHKVRGKQKGFKDSCVESSILFILARLPSFAFGLRGTKGRFVDGFPMHWGTRFISIRRQALLTLDVYRYRSFVKLCIL